MSNEVSIKGIDKAALLAALYNGSAPMGMGVFQARPEAMTIEQAREMIGVGDDIDRTIRKDKGPRRELYFDYVLGRPLKIDISGDTLQTGLYDRDNGQGSAARIVEQLRANEAQAA